MSRGMQALALVALLGGTMVSCKGCDNNAVMIVEDFVKLAGSVRDAALLQDENGDGAFTPNEKVFVIDPRGSVNKAIRLEFMVPVPRAALKRGPGETPFLEFVSFFHDPSDAFPIKIREAPEAVYFDDDPTQLSTTGTTLVVTFDLDDALEDPVVPVSDPVLVKIHLARIKEIDPSLVSFADEATYAFVIAPTGPGSDPPPRIVRVAPDAPGRPGWGRPIMASDLSDPCPPPAAGAPCGFTGILDAIDAFKLGQNDLAARPMPHGPIELEFSRPMTNFVASVQPDDWVGVRLHSETPLAFFEPFTVARSETGAGMVPSQEYRIEAESRYDVLPVPGIAATQEELGLLLMPNFEDVLYAELIAGTNPTVGSVALTNDQLYLGTPYTFITGPVRVTAPEHLGNVNATSAPGGLTTVAIEYAAPTDLIVSTIGQFEVTFRVLNPPFGPFSFMEDFDSANTTDGATLAQGAIPAKAVKVTTFAHQFVAGAVDSVIELDITACSDVSATCSAPGAELLGRDQISFHYDSIVPEIVSGSITVTNDHSDGLLDEICVTADCDVAEFVVSVPGGTPVHLPVGPLTNVTPCVGGKQTYCFEDVSLGLPPGTQEGGLDITLTAVDDQGNASAPVTVATTPSCGLPLAKFVGNGGQRLRAARLGDGAQVTAWTDGRTLRFARWTGTQWALEDVHPLPGDICAGGTCTTRYGFGLGIDMAIGPSGEPAICMVEAALGPSEWEGSGTGTLLIFQRQAGGDWAQVGDIPNARPVGCALTTFEGHLTAAYVAAEPEPTRGHLWYGRVDDGLGVFVPIHQVPIPADVPRVTNVAWDFRLASTADRLYFTYRTSNRSWDQPRAPGSVVVGYFSATTPLGYAQAVCAPGDTCPSFGGDPTVTVTSGAGPAIVVTPTSVELAYVSIEDTLLPLFDLHHSLTYLSAPFPADGMPFAFDHVFEDDDPGPVFGFTSDGITTVPPTATFPTAGFDFSSIFYSRPELAALNSPGGTSVFLSYARGGTPRAGQFGGFRGGEEIAVVHRLLDGTAPSLDVVDARVGDSTPRNTVTANAVAATRQGYWVAYRLANRVATAEQFSGVRFGTDEPLACPEYWRTGEVTDLEANLTYASFQDPPNHTLVSNECFPPLGGSSIPDNFFVAFGESVGQTTPSFLDEQFDDVRLVDGRGLLKNQTHVCVPRPVPPGFAGNAFCNPNLAGPSLFDPPVTTTIQIATSTEPAPAGSATSTCGFGNVVTALMACPNNEPGFVKQVAVNTSGICCVRCPAGQGFDAGLNQCVSCPSGTSILYQGNPVGVVPVGEVIYGATEVSCQSCDAQDPAALSRGQMPWVLTSDGASCTRCSDGSQLSACAGDDDCLVFGSAYRCSTTFWNGRANDPTVTDVGGAAITITDSSGTSVNGARGVCVPRCAVDADCPQGQCDLADGDGICRRSGSNVEQPAGIEMACRPIGCDRCWNNDFCDPADDDASGDNPACPLNHACSGDAQLLTPLCVARAALSPYAFAHLIAPNLPPPVAAQVEATISSTRSALVNLLALVKVPNQLDFIDTFNATISNVDVIQRGNFGDPHSQGEFVVRIEFDDTSGATDTGIFFNILDPWTLELVYQPSVRPRQGASSAYGGTDFVLTDLRISAELDILVGGYNIGDILVPKLRPKLAPFAGQLVRAIFNILGATVSAPSPYGTAAAPGDPDLLRCLFVKGNVDAAKLDLPERCNGQLADTQLVQTTQGRTKVTFRRCP